jgi:pSer/pThr/pTyr-binding forkhead associated (FHA) protein
VWWISDCHSLNGVYLNGCKVAESPLHHGDEIQIGDQVLQVMLGDCTSDVARSVLRSIASALGRRDDSSMQRCAS